MGPSGGNGVAEAFFDATSADGSRAFFDTDEQLVGGDTDATFDMYERQGGTTTLLSTGSTGGNGAFDVFFAAVSADGTRAFFETDEKLTRGRHGRGVRRVRACGWCDDADLHRIPGRERRAGRDLPRDLA